jgi:hypothetical protein
VVTAYPVRAGPATRLSHLTRALMGIPQATSEKNIGKPFAPVHYGISLMHS